MKKYKDKIIWYVIDYSFSYMNKKTYILEWEEVYKNDRYIIIESPYGQAQIIYNNSMDNPKYRCVKDKCFVYDFNDGWTLGSRIIMSENKESLEHYFNSLIKEEKLKEANRLSEEISNKQKELNCLLLENSNE